jgi:hypothetical protein
MKGRSALWHLSIGLNALAWRAIPGKMSGAWVFKDTRMPVSLVFALEYDFAL